MNYQTAKQIDLSVVKERGTKIWCHEPGSLSGGLHAQSYLFPVTGFP